MRKIKKSLVATVMGIIMGVTLLGSTVANADEPCNHSYGVHPGIVYYYSSTVGSHPYNGATCYIIEYLYHDCARCNRCDAVIQTYQTGGSETRHTLH